MSRSLLELEETFSESSGVPQELPYPPREEAEFVLTANSPSWWHRLYANVKAFFRRFLALALKPKCFAPLVVDYWLLLQSFWGSRQQGPDLIYPMLSIRKRQSGHLARLILEYSKEVRQYEHRAAVFIPGIDPPCIAVIDLDDASRDVVENGYSTQVDLYGLMIIFIVIEILITLAMHVFPPDLGYAIGFDWAYCAVFNLIFCLYAVLRGDGTLTLTRRSDTSTLGCVILLDQEFTVVLNGNQGVVEAIAEGSFNLSHPNSVWRPRLRREEGQADFSHDILETLCEGVCLIVFALFWLSFRPSTIQCMALMGVISMIAYVSQRPTPHDFLQLTRAWAVAKRAFLSGLPPTFFIVMYEDTTIKSVMPAYDAWRVVHYISVFLAALLIAGYKTRNYPIRSGKFLDALGRPSVRKWQFDTLAAAATFQSLIHCRGIPRPVRTIDVLALLDILIPDQRDVWKAWKERVADRIVHEKKICFTPTIPTFPDEGQRQLKELLDQAQLGYDAYRYFYD